MAVNRYQSNVETLNVRYSQFLGMLYVSNSEVEGFISMAKGNYGDAVVKKGFTGTTGGASADCRADLKKLGVEAESSVSGILTGARIVTKQLEGVGEVVYINISLRDGDQKIYLSLDFHSDSGQKLVRKLVNCQLGEITKIGVWGSYGKRRNEQMGADHNVSVKQGTENVEVPTTKLDEMLKDIDVRKAALVSAKLPEKEAAKTARKSVGIEFHQKLMEDFKTKEVAYYVKESAPAENFEDGKPAEQASTAA